MKKMMMMNKMTSNRPESHKVLVVFFLFKKGISIDPEKSKKNWDNFWVEVQKNNEQLRYYSENGMYDEV